MQWSKELKNPRIVFTLAWILNMILLLFVNCVNLVTKSYKAKANVFGVKEAESKFEHSI